MPYFNRVILRLRCYGVDITVTSLVMSTPAAGSDGAAVNSTAQELVCTDKIKISLIQD